jgi:hypothetical protein
MKKTKKNDEIAKKKIKQLQNLSKNIVIKRIESKSLR